MPIIPLIDILAILLIFFILTSTFRERKHHIAVHLPTVTHLDTNASVDPRVTLTVRDNGDIFLADTQVTDRSLTSALLDLKEARPDAKLELKADENIPLRTLIFVWDALTQSGYSIREVPALIQMNPSGP